MNCPKCKSQIPENSIKCPVCSARIGRVCPTCGGYNLITNKNCKSCGVELLKVCPHCKSINLPTSATCRKCGKPMVIEQKIQIEPDIVQKLQEAPAQPQKVVEEPAKEPEMSYEANYYSLANAQTETIEAVLDTNIRVVSINGDNEYAKAYLYNAIRKELSTKQIAFLPGKCTPHTQLTPMGFIQDILLNIFNITNFCINKSQLKKDSIKFFKQDFPTLETPEIYDLINILYPENIDDFENLFKNKEKTTKIVLKVFDSIFERMNTVILVDNMEYIDSFSFDILNILLSDESIKDRLTLIVTYTKEQSAVNHIFPESLNEENYKDITISEFSNEQIEPIFANYKDYNLSDDLKSKILHFSRHNMTLADQLIHFVKDCIDSGIELVLYDNLEELIENRLILLKKSNHNAYLVLSAIAIMGYKFHPVILTSFFGLEPQALEAAIRVLLDKHFIVESPIGYEFKTMSIWTATLTSAQKDSEEFVSINQALHQVVSKATLSSPFVKSIIAKNVGAREEQYSLLMNIAQQTAYIGDVRLYILCLKEMLNIIEPEDNPQANFVKYGIYTQLGKLMESSAPDIASDYLSRAIVMTPDDKKGEKIELLGYLASVSMRLKNYHGAIECVDKVLELTPEDTPVERVLVKTRYLKPLEALGNMGAIINMIDNDIMPILTDALNRKIAYKTISAEDLFKIYLRVHLKLMRALALQGNTRGFQLFSEILDICQKYQLNDNDYMAEIHIVYSLLNTLIGTISLSEKTLSDIQRIHSSLSPMMNSSINFISILNRYFAHRKELTFDELYEATRFADDANDEFTKNMIKLLLGKLISERTSAKEAMTIYSEQAEYFANTQNSIGVMLSWYFIAKAKMSISGVDEAIDVLTKAIDVAKMPNISNIYFSILFNKLMCDIYITKQDYESAKMYLEIAIQQAANQGIQYQVAKLQMLYVRLLQDYMMTIEEESDKLELVSVAQDELNKAEIIAQELELEVLADEVAKSKTVLKSFCQINNIPIEIEG